MGTTSSLHIVKPILLLGSRSLGWKYWCVIPPTIHRDGTCEVIQPSVACHGNKPLCFTSLGNNERPSLVLSINL